MLLISACGPTVEAPASADALGEVDAVEAETDQEEEGSSEDDAARPQPVDGLSAAARRTRRPSACLGDPLHEGHPRLLFRPPIA